MPRAKIKENPLVQQGHRVFVSYESKAFQTRTRTTASGWSYSTSRNPSPDFLEWMANTAGPRDVLWTARKAANHEGMDIFFYQAHHAILAKLTWGGA